MRPGADHLRRILSSGILAPSAENRHYLCFRMRDDSVQLLATDCASWARLPHRRLLAMMSYGAVIENIALRSAALGYRLDEALQPDPADLALIAELRWTAAAPVTDSLCNAIDARHTNRRFYRRAAVAPATLERLRRAAGTVAGARLLWLAEAQRRSVALGAILVAETERFRRRELHAELFGAVRFDRGWHDSTAEWLAPAALEVEPPMRRPFAWLRDWRAMRAMNCVGAHFALGLRAGYLPCALAPHIGLIMTDAAGDGLEDLRAGRAFQRLWLAAADEDLALQPMAAATALVRQTPGQGWVSPATKARLEESLAELCERVDGRQAHMLFRVGRADRPSAVAGRRSLHDYVM
jgi:hypothetical protein